jgi:small subunit ribosomal protein S1
MSEQTKKAKAEKVEKPETEPTNNTTEETPAVDAVAEEPKTSEAPEEKKEVAAENDSSKEKTAEAAVEKAGEQAEETVAEQTDAVKEELEEEAPKAKEADENAAVEAPAADSVEEPVAEGEEIAEEEIGEEVETEAAVSEDEEETDDEEGEIELEFADDVPTTETGEFDWEAFEKGLVGQSTDDREALEKMYEDTLTSSVEHQVVQGKIITMTDREAIIDINSKSEGVVSLNEFRYNPELKVGDEVEVLVDKQEDKYGQLVLSHRKARSIMAWDRVNEAHDADEIVKGFVKCRTKGGMIVDVFGIEAFLPGSQIDVKPIRDYDAYVNKTMEFKIVKINHEFKNVVVSHKALIEADLEEQKREIIGKLEKGQVLEGVVKNITSYGVFIDLGGVDGLVHITDLSWSRINHPSEVVELDEKVNVVILDFDDEKSRIQLGMKQLDKHPWDALDENLKVGDKITGKVVVLADYGAFVEILPGVEGLIHVSEMSWSTHLRSAQDFMSVGDEVEAQILTLDREDRKMSLGIKQLTPDPWTDITEKYALGTQHKGTVRNFTNFGIFLELEEGIDGLVHISDLSWTKKIKHPSEFTSIGSEMEAVVLDIDVENRRLSLGHKQLEENPWDNYEAVFEEGSVHEGKVSQIVDKGCEVLFETFGVEAFCPQRHMAKEDGSKLAKGDTAEFKVIEFNKDSKRIVVSHAQLHKDAIMEDKAAGKKRSQAEAKATRSNIKKVQAKVEKSTLGDLDALANLKKEMEEKEK